MTSITASHRQRPDHICIDMPEIFPQVTKKIWDRPFFADEKIQALKDVFSKEPAVRDSFENWMKTHMTFVSSSPLMTDLKRYSKSHFAFYVSHIAKEIFEDFRPLDEGVMETIFLQTPSRFASWFKEDKTRCQKAIEAFVEYVELGMFSSRSLLFFIPILDDVEILIKISKKAPRLIERLFTVEDPVTGGIPLSCQTVFEEAIPFFKSLRKTDSVLFWKMITTIDSKGDSLLHSPAKTYFFFNVLSLLTNVEDKFSFLWLLLFALNNKGESPLDDPIIFSHTIDFLMEFSKKDSIEVFTLISAIMRNRKTFLHHPDYFKRALPVLMQVVGPHRKRTEELLNEVCFENEEISLLAAPLFETIQADREVDLASGNFFEQTTLQLRQDQAV